LRWLHEPQILFGLKDTKGRVLVVVSHPQAFVEKVRSLPMALKVLKIWKLKHRKREVPRNFVVELEVLPGGEG